MFSNSASFKRREGVFRRHEKCHTTTLLAVSRQERIPQRPDERSRNAGHDRSPISLKGSQTHPSVHAVTPLRLARSTCALVPYYVVVSRGAWTSRWWYVWSFLKHFLINSVPAATTDGESSMQKLRVQDSSDCLIEQTCISRAEGRLLTQLELPLAFTGKVTLNNDRTFLRFL